ncbi:MAG: hypothetical protein IJC71_03345 [Clostridia bacterium]|nr:hypothetical protein [Clostridia bacterium]
MFGYVRPFVPELKVAQYELYRAAYCGLCRSMGHLTGQLSRMTLSYDLVFLAAVRMILEDIPPQTEQHICLAHPLKKRSIMPDNAALRYTAAVSALLAWAKNDDDRQDEVGFARLKSLLAAPLLSTMTGRAQKTLPADTDEKIRTLLHRLTQLEKEACTSADETADVFGDILSLLFSLGLTGDKERTAAVIGRSTGRFVYLCDAADDMAQDIRKNRYNPFAQGWGELALDPDTGTMSSLVRDSIRTALPIDLEILGEAAEQLDANHAMTPIVKNIVYLGLPEAMKRVTEENHKTDPV